MIRKAQVSPGKQTALQAKVGILVISLFLIFGLVFGFVVLQEVPDSESGQKLLTGGFFFLWTVVCLSIIFVFVRIISKQKIPQEASLLDVHIAEPESRLARDPGDFDSRLRKLEQLRQDGLVNEEEYLRKRDQVLQERW